MTFAALASKLRSIAWRTTRAPRDIARDGHAIDIAADRASEARAKADRNGRCWKYRCQLRVPDKRCKQTVCERERDKEGGRGSSYCPKFPSEYRKYRTSFLQVSFRGQKSSRIRDCDDLYFQVAQTLNNSIYIYIWSSVDTFSSTSQTRPILVNFERVAFVRTAFQKCLFDFTFTTVFSIFNPIFLFLSLESRNEIILREPTRKLPNFRSFIFPLEITRSTMFMRSYKSSRSLVISIPSLPFSQISGSIKSLRVSLPGRELEKRLNFRFYFIYPIYIYI